MTNKEFSDSLDTLLNSYSVQADFGEGVSKQTITLDEYEKSVILTQAQDIILKSYFDSKANSLGEGFDTSERRQTDFSSLIKNATLNPYTAPEGSDIVPFDERGIIFQLPKKKDSEGNEIDETTDVLFILNEKLLAGKIETPAKWVSPDGETTIEGKYTDEDASNCTEYVDIETAEAAGWHWEEAINKYTSFIIIPLNYKEYDREMSKPYAQPLKKQAWRLFSNQNSKFDVQSELIPRWNIANSYDSLVYKIRYVKRPCPIVLEDLPDGLNIDGVSTMTTCELNPSLHMDILNKAVEIAVATRGGARPVERAQERG